MSNTLANVLTGGFLGFGYSTGQEAGETVRKTLGVVGITLGVVFAGWLYLKLRK